MVFARSFLRGAKYAEHPLLSASSRLHTSQYNRQEPALTAPAKVKSQAKRTKKKLQDLPIQYILPDGTVAKPLGNWQYDTQSQTTCDTQSIQHDTVVIDNTVGRPTLENTDNSVAEKSPESTKTRRGRKKASTTNVIETEATVKRGKSRKNKLLSDLALESCERDEEPSPAISRSILAREIQANLRKFPHCLLLTRVGQFYESYFDQAEEIARLLSIKLTSRKLGGEQVAMCGFPIIHIDKYLKVLVQQHKRFVAMCEEFPQQDAFGAKEFERRVTRIITPGTLIDEPFLNASHNNFLLTISAPVPDTQLPVDTKTQIGLAWVDVSTGEFYSRATTLECVQDELARINPREVVLSETFRDSQDHPLMAALAEEDSFISFAPTNSIPILEEDVTTPRNGKLKSTQISLTPREQQAVQMLTSYLSNHLLENMPPLKDLVQDNSNRMQIDAHTNKALEIREANYEGGTRGSLFNVIKRTVTSGGTRLLSRWLCSPSTSLTEILARQSLVEFFVQRPHLSADLSQLLASLNDTSRLIQKFLAGRGDASDMMIINNTLRTWTHIREMIISEQDLENKEKPNYNPEEWTTISALISRMHDQTTLSDRISEALGVEDSSAEREVGSEDYASDVKREDTELVNWRLSSSSWFIRPEFSEELTLLHNKYRRLLEEKDNMELYLRTQYNALSLTLRASPGQGLHVHLSRKREHTRVSSNLAFVPISESGSTKCYFYHDWSLLGNQITTAIHQLTQAEKETFEFLRNMINELAPSLRTNSEVIDEIDVALSFAKVAVELKFVKPSITNDNVYDVVKGRHPAVEMGLLTSGRVFTPNSVQLNPESQVHVITGPNMAGKSTFLRQIALIAILAQIGSFVPAESATIGIVDKLFSRIGAKDDLFRDRSTFMVEMLETADILRRATDKSLVIMDEVGRGTTVDDGLAIAFATVHHLVTGIGCRALFATHFHELANMLGHTPEATGSGAYKNVRFYCSDVDETNDGYFAYSYRMRPGVNWDSHGLKVAQLAGLPDSVIDVASDTLNWLKQNRGRHWPSTVTLSTFGQKANEDVNSRAHI